ncbi:hypothetical protein V5799_028969 [Amblyomma americanum]|uniref:Uncharacterized protein n=1 Tax=Amblyomma americanum TaxID=6943 RepID=A0AAQ4ESJ9_AMBAM
MHLGYFFLLKPIKRDLNKYWPSLTSPEARYFAFWRHQWQKHGSCAGDVPALNGLFKFFNSTLAVYHKYNIFEFLSNSLIRPSVVRTYSVSRPIRTRFSCLSVKGAVCWFKCKRKKKKKRKSVIQDAEFY